MNLIVKCKFLGICGKFKKCDKTNSNSKCDTVSKSLLKYYTATRLSLGGSVANTIKQLIKKSRETATGAGSALVALSIALHAILDLVGVICSRLF